MSDKLTYGQIADFQLSLADKTIAELKAENQQLRAAVETAAAMVEQADPDLSAALLRLLAPKE